MMSDKASELLALALTLGRALEHFSSRAADPSVDQEALAGEWKTFAEQMSAKLEQVNGTNDNERPSTLKGSKCQS